MAHKIKRRSLRLTSKCDFIRNLIEQVKGILTKTPVGTRYTLETTDIVKKGDKIENSIGEKFIITKVKITYSPECFYCYIATLKKENC